jgi:hypothetical protein
MTTAKRAMHGGALEEKAQAPTGFLSKRFDVKAMWFSSV